MPVPLMVRVQGEQDPEEGLRVAPVWDAENNALLIGQKRKVKTVSAAYTVVGEDTGTLICVDTAATVTLPAASADLIGVFVDIACIADVTIVIAATNAGELITFNDVAANSFTWSTGGEKVGASARLTCISATKWLVQLMTEETQTTTVTT